MTASLDALSTDEALKALNRVQELLPQYEVDVADEKKIWATVPQMSAKDYAAQVKERSTREGQIEKAALDGERRYTDLKCPVLAVFALPHDHGLAPGPKRDAADAWEMQTFGPLADSFKTGVPTATVIRTPHAKHAVFESNESEVVQDIEDFVAGLKHE